MSETMVEKYNSFLESHGIVLSGRDVDDVLYRSTNPMTMESISEIDLLLVNNILEIGRSNGYSYGFFRFCFPRAKVVSIDIVRTETSVKISKLFDNNYLFVDGTSDVLRGMNIKFDIAFIDGDHTFEWCKRDWNNIRGHLSDNSVIIFDDLDWGNHGCEKFFNSLKENKVTKYVDDSPSYGLVYRNKNKES